MSRTRLIKPVPMIAGLLIGLLFASLAVPLGAQSAPKARRFYDITQEATIHGTVSSVLERAPVGTIPGPHLLLATASGAVDASLGRWGLQGKGALSVAAGEQVEVTGVMKTLKGREVFVARTVKVGGQVYIMRNEHGLSMSPQARARAGQKTVFRSEAL
jgi:hypothetical protein